MSKFYKKYKKKELISVLKYAMGLNTKLSDENQLLKKDVAELSAISTLYGSVATSLAEDRSVTPRRVQIQDGVTRIRWSDGDTTVAKCLPDDQYDKEKGIYIAALKKFLGGAEIKNLVTGAPDPVKNRKHLETVYAKLFAENRDERISALREWEKLPMKIRQSVKAKF